jgi:transposase-like protein
MSKSPSRRLSIDFKAEAVRLLESSDKTMAVMDRDLDASMSVVRSLVK